MPWPQSLPEVSFPGGRAVQLSDGCVCCVSVHPALLHTLRQLCASLLGRCNNSSDCGGAHWHLRVRQLGLLILQVFRPFIVSGLLRKLEVCGGGLTFSPFVLRSPSALPHCYLFKCSLSFTFPLRTCLRLSSHFLSPGIHTLA